MKISLPWGTEIIELNLPESWDVRIPEPEGLPSQPRRSEAGLVKASLEKPPGAKPLSKRKLGKKDILIIVDDNTRPTPAHLFFHHILKELKEGGADPKKITVLPALGIHTPMTEVEMAEKIGEKNLKKVQWENHDAFNENGNTFFGTTSRGTPVYLNSNVEKADLIILVGMVEPHLWAGFGGGLKNILPGVASSGTIGAHHGMLAEPPYMYNRVGLAPEENSFRTDLEEITGMIKADIFCVNVVLNKEKRITASFAGDPITCHRQAVELNRKMAGAILDGSVDAVITNSSPMDINFKQGMKCVGNTLPAVKSGGKIIALLKADRGLDDIPMQEKGKPLWLVKTILRLLGPARVLGFLEKVRPGLDVEQKFLNYYSMQLIREHDLHFYVPALSDEAVASLGFFKRYSSPQAAVDHVARKLPENAKVAVFPEGGATFPIFR
jgi:nickel-dependent lactate racemase